MTTNAPLLYDPIEDSRSYLKELEYIPDIRNGFIRKVFGILLTQLMFTVCFVGLIIKYEEMRIFFQYHRDILMILSSIVLIIVSLSTFCLNWIFQMYPHNYIILSLFTLCETILVGTVASVTNPDLLFQASFMTLMLVLGLTLFAFQTKYDFTTLLGIFLSITIAFFTFGLCLLFFRTPFLYTLYCSLGSFIFSVYIIIDIQLIMGNKSRSLTEDDYILGAMLLYVDIINLFLYILQLFKSRSD